LIVPLDLKITRGIKTIAIVGDHHFPYTDPITQKLINRFLEEQQPDYLIYNGDVCDFYQVSKFAKDPSRADQLGNDIKQVRQMFAYHERILPNTEKILISGTHEVRFEKWLWTKAPEVSSLEELSVPAQYQLENYGIGYVPYEQGLLINDIFLVLHGDIVSIHSSYSAKRQFERQGGCGICNHTHRMGSYYRTDRHGTWGWWENGCTCDLDPDWTMNPNWQQGFSLLHFTATDRFYVEQIPIINHAFMYGGKLYK
jgi:predicted phosphodiesterase